MSRRRDLMMAARRSRFVGILDRVPGAVAAWSDLPLSAAMVGQPAMRLREDGGSTEADFWKRTNGDFLTGAGQTVAEWLTANEASNPYTASYYDQSGNGINLVQASGASQPLFDPTTGGVRSSSFNHADRQMFSSANVGIGTYSIFSVFSATETGLVYEHGVDATANGCYLRGHEGGTQMTSLVGRSSAYSTKIGSTAMAPSGVAVFRHSFDGTHAGNVIWKNGVNLNVTTWWQADNPGSSVLSAVLYVGRSVSFSSTGMRLSALLVYSPKLSADAEAAVEALLAEAYGVAL